MQNETCIMSIRMLSIPAADVEGSMFCASSIFIQVHVDPAANFMKALG